MLHNYLTVSFLPIQVGSRQSRRLAGNFDGGPYHLTAGNQIHGAAVVSTSQSNAIVTSTHLQIHARGGAKTGAGVLPKSVVSPRMFLANSARKGMSFSL